MLWDESYESWAQLGVSLQPSAKLFSADGVLLKEWLGAFDEDEVLAIVEGAGPADGAASEPTGDADRFCRYVARFATAQADAAGYATADPDARQRIVDDLRYAANAMAQTGSGAASVDELAAAVRDYSQLIVDAGLPDEFPGGIEPARQAVRDALAANRELLLSECSVEIELTESPGPGRG